MPKTRSGANATPETSDSTENLDNTNMAAENEPTLKAIFDMVKSTNNTVTSMEIRLKRLEEEGNPEIKKISTQLDDLTTNVTVYTDQIASLEATVTTQKQEIVELSSKVSELEKQRRVHNLIVEGIPETANEDVRYKIDQLFEDLDLDFGTDCCDFIYRMGQRKQTTGRPRPIFVAFPYIRLKSKVLRNAYKLKNNPERKFTYLSEDITPEQQAKRRDLRCLNAYAKSMGVDSKLRSDTIIVDGVSFSHADIGRLPHEISLENAKVVEVEDGHAFQGEHAYLSSLYEIEIEYKDRKHRSAEHAFHHSRADENGQPDLAEQIRDAKTSREAMLIGRRIKTNEEYKAKEPALLQDIHLAKYVQHPELRAKLIKLKGNLYEATHHPIYGAGFSLAQRQYINKANVKGGNKLGLSLENIRSRIIEEESKNN